MAVTTFTGMTAATTTDVVGTAVTGLDLTESGSLVTRKVTLATLRTRMFAGGTGFTASDPLTCGIITATGNSTITGTLGGITTLTATTLAGTLSTAAQPNVTSVGTLASLSVTGGVTATAGVGAGGAYNASFTLYSYGASRIDGALTLGATTTLNTADNRTDNPGINLRTASADTIRTAFHIQQVNTGTSAGVGILASLYDSASAVADAGMLSWQKSGAWTSGSAATYDSKALVQVLVNNVLTTALTLDGSAAGAATFAAGATFAGALSGVTTLSMSGALSGLTSITATGLIQTTLTTEQMRLRYDASNYLATTVSSVGAVTINAVGTAATMAFQIGGSSFLSKSGDKVSLGAAMKLSVPTTGSVYFGAGGTPTSQENGDMWFDGTNLRLRVGGTDYTITKT